MRKITAITQVTLDGVMQSPGGHEEDPSYGFTHGGWAMPFVDDATDEVIGEIIAGEFDLLFPAHGLSPVATASTPRGVLVNTYRPACPLPEA